MTRVAFWLNAFTIRGVERAVFDYANGLERCVPGAEAWVVYHTGVAFHLDSQGRLDHDEKVFRQFQQRFPKRMHAYSSLRELASFLRERHITHLHMLRSGEREPDIETALVGITTLVHCVFTASQPHGNRYAAISPAVAAGHPNVPVVPHMVLPLVPASADSQSRSEAQLLRRRLNIHPSQVVIGRYGGSDTFDIPFVHQCIRAWLRDPQRLKFVFMNTKPIPDADSIMYLEGTIEPAAKARYIDACDVMLHARADGESFGLAVCEFAQRGKRVLTYNGESLSPVYFRNHEAVLGELGCYYDGPRQLTEWLEKLNAMNLEELRTPVVPAAIGEFSEQAVMRRFKQHFLD